MTPNSHFRPVALLACLSVFLFLASSLAAQNQALQTPRDLEKLLARAQQFWASVVKDQRADALKLVAPDRHDVYLATKSSPILEATVVGLNFLTESKDRAAIRVTVKTLSPVGERLTITVVDQWVWKGNNWFLNPPLASDMWNAMNGNLPDPEVKKVAAQIETELSGIPSELDLGSVLKETHHEFTIPVQYSSQERNLRLTIDPRPPLSLIENVLPKGGTRIRAYFDSTTIDGTFAIPTKIRFNSGQAAVERRITIKGKVFTPVTFRHVPARPSKKGDLFSVFVKNNTSENLPIQYISGEFEAEVTAEPEAISAGEEVEIKFKLVADVPPVRVDVLFKTVAYGKSNYSYVFPKTP